MTEALDMRYADWRATADGERVVGYVRQRALTLRARGWKHYGIAPLVEVARYDASLEVGPDADGLKINNSYRAFIARELMEDERLAGFFETRRSVADVPEEPVLRGWTGTEGMNPHDRAILTGIVPPELGGVVIEHEPSKPVVGANRDPRWSVEAVPVASRWRCVQPECRMVVTRESAPHLQPALGGYLAGRCPALTCYSNNRTGKQRGSSSFAPIKEESR